jgi:hypothetical protein
MFLVHDRFYRSAITYKKYFFVLDASDVTNKYSSYRFLFFSFENKSRAGRNILKRVNFDKAVITDDYYMMLIFK